MAEHCRRYANLREARSIILQRVHMPYVYRLRRPGYLEKLGLYRLFELLRTLR